jgi:ABC-2 type transport system permease protein
MADTFSLFWRPAPIATFTVRQFLGGKSARIVGILALAPVLMAAIYLINTDVATPREWIIDTTYRDVMVGTIIPIATLILATGALGNEIEDRTLPYLVLKPISRLRIVLEKFVGTLVIAVPTILLGIVAGWLVIRLGTDESEVFIASGKPTSIDPLLWPMLASATAGIVATAAVFLLISLIVPRALIVGVLYVFAWESLLGRFLPGVKAFSIRQYVSSIFVGLLDAPDATLDGSYTVFASVLTLGIVSIVALALATWRLSRMNLE